MSFGNWGSFVHKFVGSRSLTSLSLFTDRADTNFGQVLPSQKVLDELASKRFVMVAEIHCVPQVIALQRAILEKQCERGPVNVVLEHFSFEMQSILDDYQAGKMTFEQVLQAYADIGTEGHDIAKYRSVLEHARENSERVKLHAGFIPRTYARMLMREGEEQTIEAAKAKGYLPADLESIEGSELHYNMFESMITGRNMYDESLQPNETLRKVFKAQLVKDISMAHRVNQLVETKPSTDRFLVIAGKGHMLHFLGVPERVFSEHPELADDSALVICQESNTSLDQMQDDDLVKNSEESYGLKGTNPGDFLFYYETEEARAKLDTIAAYDKVGESAHLHGDLKKAKSIMSYLGYTDEEFQVAGEDAYNYQGVGNPHRSAKIQPGDKVLDVGSGLGIDSFIASHYAGNQGKVVGIDISKKEVEHAQSRAKARGLDAQFLAADMEKIPLPDSSFDVVISNGAFCLAPNKQKAFEEIFRVLKPGGRIAIYTSTVQMDLEAGVNWPTCMRMFIHKSKLKPLCEEIGFTEVVIDDSDSLMQFELPLEESDEIASGSEEGNSERHKVHVGSEEFLHLEKYDMNKLCARVCVVATKPKLSSQTDN
jgi:arsenite methyltransferase